MSAERVYCDTSFIAKLLLKEEEGADLAGATYDRADELFTSSLSYPETRSALSGNLRSGILRESEFRDSLVLLEELWRQFEIVQMTEVIALRAGDLVTQFPLSGADAVQLASALRTPHFRDLAFVTWDRRQAEAARALGFTVQPPID